MTTRITIEKFLAIAGGLALAGCSAAEKESTHATSDAEVAESIAASMGAEASGVDGAGPGTLAVPLPKMAYAFEYGFTLPAGDIGPLQERHADMCEAAGPYTCRILGQDRSGSDEDETRGRLELAVAADKARAFGRSLSDAAKSDGATLADSAIRGEDLSKAIVDTQARLRARTVLRDRLMETLRTRRGTVSELVEAERGVAQVNEEIDQARSWLAEMEGRVAYSRMTIDYASDASAGGAFLSPIRGAVGSVGSVLGTIFAALIMFATIAIPIGLAVFGVARLRRWFDNRGADAATAATG